MKKYETRIIDHKKYREDMVHVLDVMGLEGWHVVGNYTDAVFGGIILQRVIEPSLPIGGLDLTKNQQLPTADGELYERQDNT